MSAATVPSGRLVTAVVISIAAAGCGTASADEISELKSAVEALQRRIDQLEAKAKETEDANDRQTDLIAKTQSRVPSWVPNFTWKGDFRYRNENIEQEYVAGRNRDRIRARAGFVAKVNDTLRTEFQLSTTEGGDPRSPNQSLGFGGPNSRKGIYLDLAYAEWQPHADWKITGGKMKYPWARPAANSFFFDNDVNPEGLAVNFANGNLFGATFYTILAERGPTGTGEASRGNADSTMAGGQLGYRMPLGAGRLTLAASYFDFNAVQNRNVFFVNSSGGTETGGNSTKTTGCFAGATQCLTYGYEIIEAFAEYATSLGGRPLALHLDYANNAEADNGLDTAYSAGVTYGRASDPHTWEVGYIWQHHEKDALFGLYADSDFGGGNTDSEGSILRAGYAFARNWTANLTYLLNSTNIDVPVTVAGVGTLRDRDYKRLQLDLNFKY
jgi:outer membrane murein-binding lipoprotein Lpp